MKRLGPELKKPDLKNLKLPPVLGDLYQDLRDRRLLPLVALGLVALVAVPILLSGSGESETAAPPAPSPAASASAARLTVVKAAPGLREPAKRLSHLQAKDPFEQHYNAPVQQATPVGTETAVTSESSSSEVVTEGAASPPPAATGPDESGGSSPGNSGSSESGEGAPAGLVLYTFAVDVKIVRTETQEDGSKQTSGPQVHDGVLPSSSLPGDKAQVVTYMGISPKTRKPLFLVSTDVSAVFGEAKCVTGSDSCQLLELEPEIPETFVYGANNVRYKFEVLKVEPVTIGRP
jgi:hypothetical protein